MQKSEDNLFTEIENQGLVTSDTITAGITKEEKEELTSLFDTSKYSTDATRIAVLSDIHSNMVAYDAVLKDLKKREYDIAIHLGDLVGYYTEPQSVIENSFDIFDFRVMGNHDFTAIEPKNLMYSTLNKNAQHAIDHNKLELNSKSKKYLSEQTMKMELETQYGTITLVHGDPLTIFGYIYGNTRQQMEEEILRALSHVNTEYLFVGHTHIQGEYKSQTGQVYLNPGAVGQPRDRDPRAAYSIIDLLTKEIELIRVEYDISKVKKQIHSCQFPTYLGDRLEAGI